MRRTFVKLCGMRRMEDIHALTGLDLDAAGLILVPGRKRTVSPGPAREMVTRLPEGVRSVGVMMDPRREEVEYWLSRVPFDMIQLHGDESPAFCRWVKETTGVSLIKVIHIGEDGDRKLYPEAYAPWTDAILLDSASRGKRGGTGLTFPWNQVSEIRRRWERFGVPVWVAGGIRPDNVGKLMDRCGPEGVDASSGVETGGRKDRRKMKALVERVRHFERKENVGASR
ncbi:phosphoribosylanthranilate isomerase [Paludifilum halophilum]|uniref:N-(5'-phosphoribosyl)anthranilate isomerase n=1 Tax=Paludifilum halophilum TaxID=1642702 RepID=A0A235BBY5_9BACL|nr:phosphoribosylanthranilate isomerase [Paludifilum halophilum]OYD09712.1 hypothetical protein CHM34_01555 [Paludifilum halophilum]